jgi:hypothetical protein
VRSGHQEIKNKNNNKKIKIILTTVNLVALGGAPMVVGSLTGLVLDLFIGQSYK